MAVIITRRKWTRQPSGVLVPSRQFSPWLTSLVSGADRRNVIVADLSATGAAKSADGVGGIGLNTDGTTSAYFTDAAQLTPMQSGGMAYVAAVSISGTAGPSAICGEVDSLSSYIEQFYLNSQNEANVAGAVDFQIRDQAGLQRIGYTANIGINDATVHGIAFSYLNDVFRCWVDGVERAITYSVANTVSPTGAIMEHALMLHARNVRGTPGSPASATQRTYLFGRLTRGLDTAEGVALSANPYLLTRQKQRRLYFGAPVSGVVLSENSGIFSQGNLSPATAQNLSNDSATFSLGSLVPNVSIALTGVSGTFSLGTLTVGGTSVALSGVSASFLQTSFPTININPTLGTLQASFSVGNLSPSGGVSTNVIPIQQRILAKPPLHANTDSVAFKGWFNDVYKELNSGILVPGGGVYSAPVFPSRRNFLVNGDMEVNQRVIADTTGVASNGTTPQWTMDRWAITASAGLQTVFRTRGAGPLIGLPYCATITVATGNTTAFTAYFAQAIESARAINLAGLPVTLSFWAKAGPTFSTTYWQNQTFTQGSRVANGALLAIVQSGTGVNEGTFAAYTNSSYVCFIGFTPPQIWTFYQITGTVPTNAQEIKVYFQGLRTTTAFDPNAFWQITGIQLEVGTQPTAFDKIPFDQSLIECQRFYEKSFDYAVTPGPVTNAIRGAIIYKAQVASTTAGWDAPIAFKVRKAKDPTMTAYCINNAGAPTDWWNFTRLAVSGVSAFSGQGEWGFVAINPQIAADAVGNEIGLHWDASADI